MTEKSIVWVHQYGPEMASCRYRAIIPAQEVGKLNGYKTFLNNGPADILVFSKPSSGRLTENLSLAKQAKSEGTRIVIDLSDDHFHDKERESVLELANLSDGIVTGSNIMRARIYDHLKRDSAVIPDPYEFPECAPHAQGEDFLWFGHLSNFRDLVEVLPSFGQRKLRVVTGPNEIQGTIRWTPQNMAHAFDLSNICIFPSRPGNEHKTANRLLNAIRAGCFAVCSDHPSYAEFKHLVWVGNFHTGVRWSLAFTENLDELVKEAQNYIRDRYSPRTVGGLWADYLGSL